MISGVHVHAYLLFFFSQVVEDFAAEDVVYLELRTTPKVCYVYLELRIPPFGCNSGGIM